jgi:hypothetical protein
MAMTYAELFELKRNPPQCHLDDVAAGKPDFADKLYSSSGSLIGRKIFADLSLLFNCEPGID